MFIGSDNFQDVEMVYALLVFTPPAFFVPPPAFLVVLLVFACTTAPSSPFLDDFFLAMVGLPAGSPSLLEAAWGLSASANGGVLGTLGSGGGVDGPMWVGTEREGGRMGSVVGSVCALSILSSWEPSDIAE